MKKRYIIFLALAMFLLNVKGFSQLLINEYSASNLDQFPDNYGKYEDWIEIYNAGNNYVNLNGYFLSDDSLFRNKWSFPNVSVQAKGYLRIWASGRNESSGFDIHTSFKLSQTKKDECIILSNPVGIPLDYIKLNIETKQGHSRGRTLNGVNDWSVFTTPTPGASNNTSMPYVGYADKPDVSDSAGFYPGTIHIIITTKENNADIHYTLDGTSPTVASPIYTNPITVSSTKVLKAITVSSDPEVLTSFERFNTYFINVSYTMPVVSMSGTQLTNLANGDGYLEPTGSVEYFDLNKKRTAKSYGMFNKHGQDSWVLSQRSIDFVSRDEMGYNNALKEKFFAITDRDEFQRIIFRAAGDDNYPADHNPSNAGSAHIRDAYVHNLAKTGGLDLDVRTATKVIMYINGQYWGIYDIRERADDHDFTDYYYNQDKYNIQYIETWGNTWAEYGGDQALTDWETLYDYIMSHNMAIQSNFDYVKSQYDAESLVDYVLVNVFTVCSDWLNYNTGWWRGLNTDGTHKRWGYALWDNDATFGHYINYTGIPNKNADAAPCDIETGWLSDPEGHLLVLDKLRQNATFNQYYINRSIDLMNTTFNCENMIHHLDSTQSLLEPEMPAHVARWNGTISEWNSNVDQLRNFIVDRCAYMPSGLIACYDLTGPYNLVIKTEPEGAGSIKLNSILHDADLPWSGTYFGGIRTFFTATADTDYVFRYWESRSGHEFAMDSSKQNVYVQLVNNDTIIAHFQSTVSNKLPQKSVKTTVYPTLTSQITYLQVDLSKPSSVQVDLCSAQGVNLASIVGLHTEKSGKTTYDIDLLKNNCKPGMYLIKITIDGVTQTEKVILIGR